jgi:hypothetical protein
MRTVVAVPIGGIQSCRSTWHGRNVIVNAAFVAAGRPCHEHGAAAGRTVTSGPLSRACGMAGEPRRCPPPGTPCQVIGQSGRLRTRARVNCPESRHLAVSRIPSGVSADDFRLNALRWRRPHSGRSAKRAQPLPRRLSIGLRRRSTHFAHVRQARNGGLDIPAVKLTGPGGEASPPGPVDQWPPDGKSAARNPGLAAALALHRQSAFEQLANRSGGGW